MTRERGSPAESKNCEILLLPTADRRFDTKVKCPTGRASFWVKFPLSLTRVKCPGIARGAGRFWNWLVHKGDIISVQFSQYSGKISAFYQLSINLHIFESDQNHRQGPAGSIVFRAFRLPKAREIKFIESKGILQFTLILTHNNFKSSLCLFQNRSISY